MGTDIGLFVERQHGSSWVNPVELRPVFPSRFSTSPSIEMCWWPLHWPQTALFFGPAAVCRFSRGVPGDVCPELKERVLANAADDAPYSGWSLLEDLSLDLWESEMLLVESQVDARLASAFGDGERRIELVAESLAELGTTWQSAVEGQRGRKLTSQPQDWADRRRHELFNLPAGRHVSVTYRQKIADFAGPVIWDRGLARMRGRSPLASYRIISAIG